MLQVMRIKMTQKELDKILDIHYDWIYRSKEPTSPVRLAFEDLTGLNLSNRNLIKMNFAFANLTGVNFSNSLLRGADLSHAICENTNFTNCDLRESTYEMSNFYNCNFTNCTFKPFKICPEEGSFVAWKAVKNDLGADIIKVFVPSDAKRTNSICSRKIRVSKLIVCEGYGESPIYSDTLKIYEEGQLIDDSANYNGDIGKECAGGLHVFITRKEAEDFLE